MTNSTSLRRRRAAAVVVLVAGLALARGAFAQVGGPYDLTWNTFDAGGASYMNGDVYALGGTAGQPDATVMTGGDITLAGGFWEGGIDVSGVTPPPDGPDGPDAPGGGATAATAFLLRAGGPNASGATTDIHFGLPQAAMVQLEVFGLQGERIRGLAEGPMSAGEHEVRWDGRTDGGQPVGSGIYFIRLQAGDRMAMTRVLRLE